MKKKLYLLRKGTHNFLIKRIVLLVMALLSEACKQNPDLVLDAGGVAINLPYQWKATISDDNELVYAAVSTPIASNDKSVLVGARKNRQRSIISLDALSGEPDWQWQDLQSITRDPDYKDPFDIGTSNFYLDQSLFFFPYNTSSYCLNLKTGQTVRKYKTNLARFDITGGIGNIFFSAGGTYSLNDDERLYMGRMGSEQPEAYLLTPSYEKVDKPFINGFGMIKGIVPFANQNDTLVSLLFIDQSADTRLTGTTVSGLYNISKRKWVYERMVMNPNKETWGAGVPALQDQRVYYTSGRGIHCYDVMTGQNIWSFPASQGFSSFVLANGKLYTNCEDRYTYCLDAKTGQQLWKEESSGTSSPLTYLNGVLYFLGGGDGKLHAIDANTGQHLWRVKSPDLAVNSGAWFYGVCVAVPGKDGNKGRIVATTGLNAYGYEAIR